MKTPTIMAQSKESPLSAYLPGFASPPLSSSVVSSLSSSLSSTSSTSSLSSSLSSTPATSSTSPLSSSLSSTPATSSLSSSLSSTSSTSSTSSLSSSLSSASSTSSSSSLSSSLSSAQATSISSTSSLSSPLLSSKSKILNPTIRKSSVPWRIKYRHVAGCSSAKFLFLRTIMWMFLFSGCMLISLVESADNVSSIDATLAGLPVETERPFIEALSNKSTIFPSESRTAVLKNNIPSPSNPAESATEIISTSTNILSHISTNKSPKPQLATADDFTNSISNYSFISSSSLVQHINFSPDFNTNSILNISDSSNLPLQSSMHTNERHISITPFVSEIPSNNFIDVSSKIDNVVSHIDKESSASIAHTVSPIVNSANILEAGSGVPDTSSLGFLGQEDSTVSPSFDEKNFTGSATKSVFTTSDSHVTSESSSWPESIPTSHLLSSGESQPATTTLVSSIHSNPSTRLQQVQTETTSVPLLFSSFRSEFSSGLFRSKLSEFVSSSFVELHENSNNILHTATISEISFRSDVLFSDHSKSNFLEVSDFVTQPPSMPMSLESAPSYVNNSALDASTTILSSTLSSQNLTENILTETTREVQRETESLKNTISESFATSKVTARFDSEVGNQTFIFTNDIRSSLYSSNSSFSLLSEMILSSATAPLLTTTSDGVANSAFLTTSQESYIIKDTKISSFKSQTFKTESDSIMASLVVSNKQSEELSLASGIFNDLKLSPSMSQTSLYPSVSPSSIEFNTQSNPVSTDSLEIVNSVDIITPSTTFGIKGSLNETSNSKPMINPIVENTLDNIPMSRESIISNISPSDYPKATSSLATINDTLSNSGIVDDTNSPATMSPVLSSASFLSSTYNTTRSIENIMILSSESEKIFQSSFDTTDLRSINDTLLSESQLITRSLSSPSQNRNSDILETNSLVSILRSNQSLDSFFDSLSPSDEIKSVMSANNIMNNSSPGTSDNIMVDPSSISTTTGSFPASLDSTYNNQTEQSISQSANISQYSMDSNDIRTPMITPTLSQTEFTEFSQNTTTTPNILPSESFQSPSFSDITDHAKLNSSKLDIYNETITYTPETILEETVFQTTPPGANSTLLVSTNITTVIEVSTTRSEIPASSHYGISDNMPNSTTLDSSFNTLSDLSEFSLSTTTLSLNTLTNIDFSSTTPGTMSLKYSEMISQNTEALPMNETTPITLQNVTTSGENVLNSFLETNVYSSMESEHTPDFESTKSLTYLQSDVSSVYNTSSKFSSLYETPNSILQSSFVNSGTEAILTQNATSNISFNNTTGSVELTNTIQNSSQSLQQSKDPTHSFNISDISTVEHDSLVSEWGFSPNKTSVSDLETTTFSYTSQSIESNVSSTHSILESVKTETNFSSSQYNIFDSTTTPNNFGSTYLQVTASTLDNATSTTSAIGINQTVVVENFNSTIDYLLESSNVPLNFSSTFDFMETTTMQDIVATSTITDFLESMNDSYNQNSSRDILEISGLAMNFTASFETSEETFVWQDISSTLEVVNATNVYFNSSSSAFDALETSSVSNNITPTTTGIIKENSAQDNSSSSFNLNTNFSSMYSNVLEISSGYNITPNSTIVFSQDSSTQQFVNNTNAWDMSLDINASTSYTPTPFLNVSEITSLVDRVQFTSPFMDVSQSSTIEESGNDSNTSIDLSQIMVLTSPILSTEEMPVMSEEANMTASIATPVSEVFMSSLKSENMSDIDTMSFTASSTFNTSGVISGSPTMNTAVDHTNTTDSIEPTVSPSSPYNNNFNYTTETISPTLPSSPSPSFTQSTGIPSTNTSFETMDVSMNYSNTIPNITTTNPESDYEPTFTVSTPESNSSTNIFEFQSTFVMHSTISPSISQLESPYSYNDMTTIISQMDTTGYNETSSMSLTPNRTSDQEMSFATTYNVSVMETSLVNNTSDQDISISTVDMSDVIETMVMKTNSSVDQEIPISSAANTSSFETSDNSTFSDKELSLSTAPMSLTETMLISENSTKDYEMSISTNTVTTSEIEPMSSSFVNNTLFPSHSTNVTSSELPIDTMTPFLTMRNDSSFSTPYLDLNSTLPPDSIIIFQSSEMLSSPMSRSFIEMSTNSSDSSNNIFTLSLSPTELSAIDPILSSMSTTPSFTTPDSSYLDITSPTLFPTSEIQSTMLFSFNESISDILSEYVPFSSLLSNFSISTMSQLISTTSTNEISFSEDTNFTMESSEYSPSSKDTTFPIPSSLFPSSPMTEIEELVNSTTVKSISSSDTLSNETKISELITSSQPSMSYVEMISISNGTTTSSTLSPNISSINISSTSFIEDSSISSSVPPPTPFITTTESIFYSQSEMISDVSTIPLSPSTPLSSNYQDMSSLLDTSNSSVSAVGNSSSIVSTNETTPIVLPVSTEQATTMSPSETHSPNATEISELSNDISIQQTTLITPSETMSRNTTEILESSETSITQTPITPSETMSRNTTEILESLETSITQTPITPSETMSRNTTEILESSDTSIKQIPITPSETMSRNTTEILESSDMSITQIPITPSETMSRNTTEILESSDTSITQIPITPSETMSRNTTEILESSDTPITQIPITPSETMSRNTTEILESSDTSITQIPITPSETMSPNTTEILESSDTYITQTQITPSETMSRNTTEILESSDTSIQQTPITPSETILPNATEISDSAGSFISDLLTESPSIVSTLTANDTSISLESDSNILLPTLSVTTPFSFTLNPTTTIQTSSPKSQLSSATEESSTVSASELSSSPSSSSLLSTPIPSVTPSDSVSSTLTTPSSSLSPSASESSPLPPIPSSSSSSTSSMTTMSTLAPSPTTSSIPSLSSSSIPSSSSSSIPTPPTSSPPPTLSTLPTIDNSAHLTSYWVSVGLLIRKSVDVTTAPFKSEMEKNLANAYARGKQIQEEIDNGTFESLGKKRRKRRSAAAANDPNVKVEVTSIQREPDTTTVNVNHVLQQDGALVPASEASKQMALLNNMELAIQLNQVVGQAPKPYISPTSSSDDDDNTVLIAGAVSGAVAAIIILLIIFCCCCGGNRCCFNRSSREFRISDLSEKGQVPTTAAEVSN